MQGPLLLIRFTLEKSRKDAAMVGPDIFCTAP